MMRRAVGLAAVVVLALSAPAAAKTINVTTHADQFGSGAGKCALREAIQAANSDAAFGGCKKGSGRDRIVLGKGTYRLSIETNDSTEDSNTEGDLDTKSNMTIAGRGAKSTTIDGNGRNLDERILNQRSGQLTVTRVTLRGGHEIDDASSGGAIFNESTSSALKVDRSRVIGNFASSYGGGLATVDAPLRITRTLVADNAAGDYGGGLSSYSGDGDISLLRSRVTGNTADSGSGGMIVGGFLRVIRSTINANTGDDYAGGIDLTGSGATIRNSTFAGNRSTDSDSYGGALYDEDNTGPVLIEGSTFSDNFARRRGGAIYTTEDENWTIRNSTFARNEAKDDDENQGYGGAIYNNGADMSLRNVTIAGNYAWDVGGVYIADGDTDIKNSILARNRDQSDQEYNEDCSGVTSLGHNLIGDGSCSPGETDLFGTSLSPLDPRLGTLSSNGGPTKTLALLAGSRAINKGKGCPKRDQRGVKRRKCDIGAFERR